MAETKRQKKRTQLAADLEKWVGKNQTSKQQRAVNRRIEKRKGRTTEQRRHQ